MIYAILKFPKYHDGTRKVKESIHPSFASAYDWADKQLPAQGEENQFIHTLDDIIEHALACTREAQPVHVETTTILHSGYHRYILTLEVR